MMNVLLSFTFIMLPVGWEFHWESLAEVILHHPPGHEVWVVGGSQYHTDDGALEVDQDGRHDQAFSAGAVTGAA